MSPLEQLQAALTLKMSEIDALCRDHGYAAVPTLLLRHDDGASHSLLISNDSLSQVVLCIAALGDIGKRSDMSPHEAALKLFTNEGS